MLTNNAGFNCNAARVIVQHAGWDQRRARCSPRCATCCAQVPPRRAYYPGAADRFDAFLAAHPDAAEQLRRAHGRRRLPWTLIPGLDPDEARRHRLHHRGLLRRLRRDAALDGGDRPPSSSTRPWPSATTRLWGTLNVTLHRPPRSRCDDPESPTAVERAIADLRYGTVSVNHWAAVGYGLVVTPWGAFPGHTAAGHPVRRRRGAQHADVRARRRRRVVRAPFRVWPKPVWFATHKTAHR